MMVWRKALYSMMVLMMYTACDRQDISEMRILSTRDALTLSPDQDRVLGFEDSSDWSRVDRTSTASTQGSYSALVAVNGWTEVASIPLSTLGEVSDTLSVDIRLPSVQYWGELRVVVKIPSLGVYYQELGIHSISGLSADMFHTFEFDIPPSLVDQLAQSYSDLTLTVIINAESGDYLLDRLDVGQDEGAMVDGGAGDGLEDLEIMGFENAAHWTSIRGAVAPTPLRTQGASALAFSGLANYVPISSSHLSSESEVLADLEESSRIAVDLMLPPEQPNPYWNGALQMFVSCPSLDMHNVYLGQHELTGKRTRVYETYSFTVPEETRTSLVGATYSDLFFTLVLNVPSGGTGVYRLDNLRVKKTVSIDPENPEGGESQELIAWKSYLPADEKIGDIDFPLSAIQIPRRFYVIKGNAGIGTASFSLGIEGVNEITCQYDGDPDTGGTYYKWVSCSGNEAAGDLVPADFANLRILSGDFTAGKTKIFAQLAQNPVGDDLGAKIPPIPTYFGRTMHETETILREFIYEQKNLALSEPVSVKLPTPHFTPQPWVDEGGGPPLFDPELDIDPPFGMAQGLTGSQVADAIWHVNGNIGGDYDVNTGYRLAYVGVEAGIDTVIFDHRENNLLQAWGEAWADSSSDGADSSAYFCYEVKGITSDCPIDVTGHVPFDERLVDIPVSVPLIPPLMFLVFTVEADGSLRFSADVSGSLSSNGANIAFEPEMSASVTVNGEAGLPGFGGGGVYGSMDLIDVRVPVTAGVTMDISTNPADCNFTITESLSANAVVSALGGEFGWTLRGGLTCGFWSELCWEDSGIIFPWEGTSTTVPIYPETPVGTQIVPLNTALCGGDILAYISHPVESQTFWDGTNSYLDALAWRSWQDSSMPEKWNYAPIEDCAAYSWSSSNSGDIIVPTSGSCTPDITYNGAGDRTIRLEVVDGYGSGSDEVSVNVGAITAGTPTVEITSPSDNFLVVGCHEPVTFTAVGTDPEGESLSYEWWLRGTPGTGTLDRPIGDEPSIVYDESVGWRVEVIVTDPDGLSATAQTFVQWVCIS